MGLSLFTMNIRLIGYVLGGIAWLFVFGFLIWRLIFRETSVINTYITPFDEDLNKLIAFLDENKIQYFIENHNGASIVKYEVDVEVNKKIKDFIKENNL